MSQNFTNPSRSQALAAQILTHAAYSVLDNEIGKVLNYGQLQRYPKYEETWNKYFSKRMGRLCQGVGKGNNDVGKSVEGTNIFFMSSDLKTYQRTV